MTMDKKLKYAIINCYPDVILAFDLMSKFVPSFNVDGKKFFPQFH